MVGTVREMASMKLRSCERWGRMGCVTPAVPSKLSWVTPIVFVVTFVLLANPQTGGNSQGT